MYKILKPSEKGLFTGLITSDTGTTETLTKRRLLEVMRYDTFTGNFHWLKSFGNRKAGDVAGRLSENGYLLVSVDCRIYRVHRLVWLYQYGKFPEQYVDHIDGDKLNNRLCNLREATLAENQKNQGIPKHNTSGFKGVYWNSKDKKWIAKSQLRGKMHYLGGYATPEEASEVYQEFCRNRHGEFYRDTTRILP